MSRPSVFAPENGEGPRLHLDERDRTYIDDLLARDLRDASAGTFMGWGTHPAIDVARLALATGHASDDVIANLLRIVTANSTNPDQRRRDSCLIQLRLSAASVPYVSVFCGRVLARSRNDRGQVEPVRRTVTQPSSWPPRPHAQRTAGLPAPASGPS